LKAILFKDNILSLAGYYNYTATGKDEWIPLLPRYSVYFSLNDKFLKFKKEEPSATNSDYCLFQKAENIILLQAIVATKYPNIFSNCKQVVDALKKEKQLRNKLKRKTIQIDELIKKKPDTPIKQSTFFEPQGKTLSTKEIQALMVAYYEQQYKIDNLKRKITCFKRSIEDLKNKLEEPTKIQFTKAIAAAGLVAGVFYNVVQSLLAIIGITNKIHKNTYYHYQKMYFSSLITSAKSSAAKALQKCIEYAIKEGKKVLPIGFNCYSHKPVVVFYIVQKVRVAKEQTGLINTLNEENFNKFLRQMEHAILIEVLNQVSTLLEDADLHLE
ncbi:7844_t:CDS:2, partial [Gigaspora margarita]